MSASILSCLVLFPPAGLAEIVWRGDFETGDISQYTGAQMVSPDRLQVVTEPVFEGRYAMRATVIQGDDPIRASGNRNELVYRGGEREGDEFFYRWQVMFAEDFPSVRTWQLFTQWHHLGRTGSPPVEFYVFGEEMRLRLGARTIVWTSPLERGVWHDFVFRVRWSVDPSKGLVELWRNGRRELEETKHATMLDEGVYLKVGLYRNAAVEEKGVVYHDGFTMATRLEDLLPTKAAER